jgi:hypothetical protein
MEVNTCSSLGLASGGTRWQLLAIHPAPHYKAAFRLLSSNGVLNQLLTMIQSVPKTALLISRLRIQAFYKFIKIIGYKSVKLTFLSFLNYLKYLLVGFILRV